MTNKLLLSIILLTSGILTSGCTGDFPPEQEIDYYKDVKPLIESKSTCVDFIGEIFTEERMKLSCAEGKFSLDACPYSDLGGCQATPGTVSESIAWSYDYGGEPISIEEASYLARACNAMPVGKWVLPDDLLKK